MMLFVCLLCKNVNLKWYCFFKVIVVDGDLWWCFDDDYDDDFKDDDLLMMTNFYMQNDDDIDGERMYEKCWFIDDDDLLSERMHYWVICSYIHK